MGPSGSRVIIRNETWTLWTEFFRKALSNSWKGNIKVWRADMKKAPPLTPKWHKFNPTHISSEFGAPTKIKREKTCACPLGTYFGNLSADWDFCFWVIVPFCPLLTPRGTRRDWMFKGARVRCSASFKIIGNTNCNYYEKTSFSPFSLTKTKKFRNRACW